MKIISLVENVAKNDLCGTHGLSLYIETEAHKILFDLGPDDTLFKNAQKIDLDLSQVDTVIISHGHYDHGGALRDFLQINSKAKIYVQKNAFQPHYSKLLLVRKNIGIDRELMNHLQVVLLDGDYKIDEELYLFVVNDTSECYSKANDSLYENNVKDTFLHEQNLIIKEKHSALIMGCGHTGIVNIMRKAVKHRPQICVGGFHLFNPATKQTVPKALLNNIAEELQKYPDVKFYTCHCTGIEAFKYLSEKISKMFYLSCGDVIEE